MSVVARDTHLLGNLVSEGSLDLDGTVDGNVRCTVLTVREQGVINGEAEADTVFIYGKVKGLIRARIVHLYASSRIEGIVMHESLTIEDGAFIDGKCKRTDKASAEADSDENSGGAPKIMENIRLIR